MHRLSWMDNNISSKIKVYKGFSGVLNIFMKPELGLNLSTVNTKYFLNLI